MRLFLSVFILTLLISLSPVAADTCADGEPSPVNELSCAASYMYSGAIWTINLRSYMCESYWPEEVIKLPSDTISLVKKEIKDPTLREALAGILTTEKVAETTGEELKNAMYTMLTERHRIVMNTPKEERFTDSLSEWQAEAERRVCTNWWSRIEALRVKAQTQWSSALARYRHASAQ